MIPFKTKDFSFSIPSDFNDLTMFDLKFIQENINDEIKVAERLTGLTIDQLSKIDITPIIETLNFMNEPLNEIEPKQLITVNEKTYFLPENINLKTWYQQIEAFKAYEKGNRHKVIAVYLEPVIRGKKKSKPKKTEALAKELDKLSVQEFFSCFNYLENQIKAIIERLKNMPEPKITPEQIEAGAKSFNVLGEFNTIDSIAQGNPLNYDKVLLLPYSVIFNKLYKNNLNSIFEIKHNEIMTKKANQGT